MARPSLRLAQELALSEANGASSGPEYGQAPGQNLASSSRATKRPFASPSPTPVPCPMALATFFGVWQDSQPPPSAPDRDTGLDRTPLLLESHSMKAALFRHPGKGIMV